MEWLHISYYVLIDLMRLHHVNISYSWLCLIVIIGLLQRCWIVNLVFDEMAAHWYQLQAEDMIFLLHISELRLMFTIHICYCSKINVFIGCHVCKDFIVFCLPYFLIIGSPYIFIVPWYGMVDCSKLSSCCLTIINRDIVGGFVALYWCYSQPSLFVVSWCYFYVP